MKKQKCATCVHLQVSFHLHYSINGWTEGPPPKKKISWLIIVIIRPWMVWENLKNPTRKKSSAGDGHALVILVLDELDNNLLLRLDLEHLQCKAHKGCGLPVASKCTSKMIKLHGLIYECLSCRAPRIQVNTIFCCHGKLAPKKQKKQTNKQTNIKTLYYSAVPKTRQGSYKTLRATLTPTKNRQWWRKKTHTCETKALLLPISILVYLGAQDLLHQILRIRAMDAPRRGVRPVRHAAAAVRRHELRKLAMHSKP